MFGFSCLRLVLSLLQVGAVLTETGAGANGSRRVLSTGRNEVEGRRDASAHAEMLCLQVSSRRHLTMTRECLVERLGSSKRIVFSLMLGAIPQPGMYH